MFNSLEFIIEKISFFVIMQYSNRKMNEKKEERMGKIYRKKNGEVEKKEEQSDEVKEREKKREVYGLLSSL